MGGWSETGPGRRGEASLKGLLEGVLSNLDLAGRFREHLAMLAWPGIAGRVVAAHSRPEAVRDGVLMVATDTPAWAQELQMRRAELLERLGARVGQGVIREIHFRSGMRRAKGRASRRPGPAPGEMKLSGRWERAIEAAAGQIEDVALRERAERAFRSLARMAEWRRKTGWRRCKRCGQWSRSGKRWCASCAHAGGRGRRG